MTISPTIRDYAERAARTFAQAAIAVLVTDMTGITSVDVWRGAALAGLAAVLTLVHGWLSPATQSTPIEIEAG